MPAKASPRDIIPCMREVAYASEFVDLRSSQGGVVQLVCDVSRVSFLGGARIAEVGISTSWLSNPGNGIQPEVEFAASACPPPAVDGDK
jgi:hypothetical protein